MWRFESPGKYEGFIVKFHREVASFIKKSLSIKKWSNIWDEIKDGFLEEEGGFSDEKESCEKKKLFY